MTRGFEVCARRTEGELANSLGGWIRPPRLINARMVFLFSGLSIIVVLWVFSRLSHMVVLALANPIQIDYAAAVAVS